MQMLKINMESGERLKYPYYLLLEQIASSSQLLD